MEMVYSSNAVCKSFIYLNPAQEAISRLPLLYGFGGQVPASVSPCYLCLVGPSKVLLLLFG